MTEENEPAGGQTHAAQQRQRASQLAQAIRTELHKAVVGQALSPRPQQRMSSAEFCRQVAHLQTLRNAL